MSIEGSVVGGKYEVVRAITSGGMGSIYEARLVQDKSHRVALKGMLPHLMEGEQGDLFKTKFRQEVAFLRTLTHPGIPKLYDAFVHDGIYYIVMEFIVGRNLDQELEERRHLTGEFVSEMQLIQDMRQALEILHYLHSQKPPLLHRDIKPANLIREHPSGQIRLVDFGLARQLHELGKTQTQLGTLGYSPLEQMRGKAEQRSDLYALGATMHHLVTGRTPEALNIPPVLQLRPDLNPALAAIIDRACATDIEVRYASARDMLRDLERLLPNSPKDDLKVEVLPRAEDSAPLRTYTSADRGMGRPRASLATNPQVLDQMPEKPPFQERSKPQPSPLPQETQKADLDAYVQHGLALRRRKQIVFWISLAVLAVLLGWGVGKLLGQ